MAMSLRFIAVLLVLFGSQTVGFIRLDTYSLAANRLTTKADDAVFWSGIRNGDSAAAEWVARNGGSTLETTLSSRGIKLPAWDANNPAVVSAWRQASADFASVASGNVRVLQSDAVRLKSVWAAG